MLRGRIAFVGRQAHVSAFLDALDDPDGPAVQYWFGPGGIGKTTLDVIQGAAIRANISLWEGLTRAKELGLNQRALTAIDKFVQMINDWTGEGTFMGASVASTIIRSAG